MCLFCFPIRVKKKKKKKKVVCSVRDQQKQECPSVEGQPPACLKNSMENVHQISLTLLKVEVWGVVNMHCFDLDLGPMTLILKLNLDMVVTYLHAKH